MKTYAYEMNGGSGPEWPQVENFSRKKNRNFSGLLKDSRKKLWSRINRNNQGTQPAKKKGGIHRILVRKRRFFPGFVAENSRDGHGRLDSIPKRQSWILPPKHKNWKVNGADRILGLITKSPRGDVFKWPKEKEIYIISEAEEVLAILTTWTTLPR